MDNQTNTCAMCGAHFNSQQELMDHAKQAHSDNSSEEQQEHSITCSKCGMKAGSNEELKKHEQQHGMNG